MDMANGKVLKEIHIRDIGKEVKLMDKAYIPHQKVNTMRDNG